MGVLDDYKYSTGNTGGNGTATFGVKLGSAISGVATSVGKAVGSLFDPSQARLGIAGLLNGAASTKANTTAPVSWITQNGGTQSAGVLADDWRIRLSVAPKSSLLYNNHTNKFLQPILNTCGVIFPVTPNLQVTHTAKYSPTSLTHSNYGMHFYEGSEVASIMIAGEFPIQNIEEGQYLLAAIYFFRAATKMFWGENDEFAGTPPPMLFLDGYGAHYFPHVSCVVTSFQHSLPDNVDYIDVPTLDGTGEKTRLPTLSTLSVTVQPLMSRTAAHKFDLEEFAHGKMITGGYM